MDIEFDEVPESLVIDRGPKVNLGLLQSILRPKTVEIRAETAFNSAIMFLNMLREEYPNEDEYRRLMMNWLRAVKDADFKKFRRVLQRAERDAREKTPGNE